MRKKKCVMKRIEIAWDEKLSDDSMNGIVTLYCFEGNDCTSISETFTCTCSVSKNSVGMSGIGLNGVIVPLTEKEINQVNELIYWYFAGKTRSQRTYSWLMEGR